MQLEVGCKKHSYQRFLLFSCKPVLERTIIASTAQLHFSVEVDQIY